MPAAKKICLVILLGIMHCYAFCQCTIQSGPAPDRNSFNTGKNYNMGTLPGGANDLNWVVAMDSINGTYQQAVVMSTIPDVYYKATQNAVWISLSGMGSHSGDRFIFFKTTFNMPCTNPCGKPFTGDNAFILNLDLHADNSIYEIYVNGKPQSGNLGGIIPVPTPYEAAGSSPTGGISVKLDKGWKPGENTLVIQVASSAPITGLIAEAYIPPTNIIYDTVKASICGGKNYQFGNQTLTQPGTYRQTFHPAGGCDSTVVLLLGVTPQTTTIDTAFCEGGSYAGYTKTGTYTDKFTSSLGCDSTRILHLTVYSNPHPHIEQDSILCTGDSLVISPGTFLSYLWQDGSILNHYVVTKPGTYTVTVTSACGILKSAVYVNEVSCTYILFPSGFTPNHDGRNDDFNVLTHFQLSAYKLTVFNRFGQQVFATEDVSKGWDGTFNGIEQPTCTYVWFATYKKGGITYNQKGTIVLIR